MTPTMGAHPAADIFPMMPEAELAALAADIKVNGQRQPVLLTVDGLVLDGRNRLAACEIAGVEAVTEVVEVDDPMALVVSLNVKRRNLSSGQKAIAAAEAWGLYEIGQGKRTSGNSSPKSSRTREGLAADFGVSDKYVQMARALLKDAPDLAGSVKDDARSLGEAYELLKGRRLEERKAREDAAKRTAERDRLQAEHADLFELIERAELTVSEAMVRLAEREQEARSAVAAIQQRRAAVTKWLTTAVRTLDQPLDPEDAVRTAELFDHGAAEERITAARLRQAAAFALSLADVWKEN